MKDIEIETLKTRLAHLERVNDAMYQALGAVWQQLEPLEMVANVIAKCRPQKCLETINAAMKARNASQSFEDALRVVANGKAQFGQP